MYTGTLIEDLMATVERAEQQTYQQKQNEDVESWFAQSDFALLETNYQGVA
jgi:hypothetical protein